jgi:PKD repeat protein
MSCDSSINDGVEPPLPPNNLTMMTPKSRKGKTTNGILLRSALSFLLAAWVSLTYLNAQPREIELVPSIYAKPFWAAPKYWEKPNLFVLDSIVRQWAKVEEEGKGEQEEGEENPYLNAYRRWRRQQDHHVNHRGDIVPPATDPFTAIGNATATQGQDAVQSVQQFGDWKLLGPTSTYSEGTIAPWQSNIYTLAVDPKDTRILYAGSETGNVFKSIDKGLNWISVGDNLPFLNGAVTSVVVAPDATSTVYAFAQPAHLIKSTDGGANWQHLSAYTYGMTEDVEVNLASGAILVATDKGVAVSNNAGLTWTVSTGTSGFYIFDIAVTRHLNPFVLASGKDSNGKLVLLRSTDGGTSFANVTGSLFNLMNTGSRMAVTPSNTGLVYAVVLADFPTILRSTDGGLSWQVTVKSTVSSLSGSSVTAGLGMSAGQGFFDLDICVSPVNASELIVGSTTAYKSIDGGFNFRPVGGYHGSFRIHPDIQCIRAVSGDSYIATDGGVTHSSDFFTSTSNATVRTRGLSAPEFWGFGQGWGEDIVVGGRYHNGNMAYMEGFGTGNTLFLGGAEDATGHVFHGYERTVGFRDIGTFRLPVSITGSVTSAEIRNTKWPSDDFYGQFSSRLVTDPRYRNVFYLGNGKSLWKSVDAGSSYAVLYTFPARVWRFDLARSNPDVIYACTDDGVFRSRDGGRAFSQLSLPAGVAFSWYSADIVVDPRDENALVLSMGNHPSETNRVFQSIDGGATWTNITGAMLKGTKVAYLQMDGGLKRGVYAVTNFPGKVYYRDRDMSEWVDFSKGLPTNISARLGGLVFFRDEKIRICGNRGVWESPLYQSPEPVAHPMADKYSVSCSRDTVGFMDYSMLNYSGAAWQWDFPGAKYVSSISSRNPKVVYHKAGSYDVTLTVTDAKGRKHTRTVKQMVAFPSDICSLDSMAGKAVRVAMDSTVIDIGKADINSNAFTIMCWMRPLGLQKSFAQLVSHDPYLGSPFGFGLGFSFLGYTPNLRLCYTDNTVGYGNASSLAADTSQWNHVTLVYSPNGVTIYLNGVGEVVNSRTMPVIDLSKTPFYINKDIHNQGGYFRGFIDEVRIYNYALTEEQVRARMHLVATEPEAGLLKYVQFNRFNGSDTYDAIGGTGIQVPPSFVTQSTAPIGKGAVQRVAAIKTSGTHRFDEADFSMDFNAPGPYPNGDVYVYRINQPPDYLMDAHRFRYRGSYWVVRNFGSNRKTSVSKMTFRKLPVSGAGHAKGDFRLYQRKGRAYDSSWVSLTPTAEALGSSPGMVNSVDFTVTDKVDDFGQYLLMDGNVVDTSVIVSGKLSICSTDSVVLTAGTAGAYQWLKNGAVLSGATSKRIAIREAGTYRVIASSASGYSDTSSPRVVQVLPSPASPSVSGVSYCQGATASPLNATPNSGNTLVWYGISAVGGTGSSTAPVPSTSAAGLTDFYVSQRNTANSCEGPRAKITVTVKSSPAKPSIALDVDGSTLVSSALAGNQWYRDGAEIVGATLQRYKPTSNGNYTVRSSLDGCTGPLSVAYPFTVTGLLDLGNGRYIRLYPNPLLEGSLLMVDWLLGSMVRSLRVTVRDNNGREVASHQLDRRSSALKIFGGAGIYYLEFRWKEGGRSNVRVMSVWVSG